MKELGGCLAALFIVAVNVAWIGAVIYLIAELAGWLSRQ